MPTHTDTSNSPWPEAMATVTVCKYEFGAGRALAFGVPTTRHFRITFNYWAPNAEGTPELRTGEFSSPTAVPQGTLFPIHYNPAAPHETTHSRSEPSTTRTPLLTIGLIGSALFLLIGLLILRGC